MGALRIDELHDQLLHQALRESADQVAPPGRRAVGLGPNFAATLLLAAGLALAGGSAMLWRAHLASSAVVGEDPFAFFEIKALDPDGRAVAGAVVTSAGAEVGVTDSFGEWRRFIRVKLGSSMPLQLNKMQAGETLGASKNVAIPEAVPASGALTIKGRIEMSRVGTAPLVKAKKPAPVDAVSR